MQELAGAAVLFAVIIIVSSIAGLVLYVLMSIGLYKLSDSAGIEYAWLSWVPIGNMYILGKILGSVDIGDLEIPDLCIVLPIGVGASLILGKVPIIGTILSILMYILMIVCLYHLYLRYKNGKAVLYTVLGAVLPFLIPIFIFIIGNSVSER